ncbi:MAG: hypothetical protein LAP13_02400 [Acidobacteriia bacterium]|nr:hypothetical protein [Terriglobia bacterium]
MRFVAVIILVVGSSALASAQQPRKAQAPPKPPGTPATTEPATERITAPPTAPPPATASPEPGFMEPAQVQALLHKVWLAQYRINDLLTEVKPERWKVSDSARQSFNQTLGNLRKGLAAQEDWRSQFEQRPDSMYLGYELYVAMNSLLPRLDGVAKSVSQNENSSLGAQYSQAENQLFDLQQALQPYLTYMMRNRDQVLYATQTNLASCENQLGYALHGRMGRATPMKNVAPVFKGHPRHRRTKEPEANAKSAAQAGGKSAETKPADKAAPPAGKPGEKK